MSKKAEEKRICSGNLDDGVDIDLVQYAGLTSFTPEQYDQLADAIFSDFELLERSGQHYLILMDDDGNEQTEATDNMDERYFFLYTDDEVAFKLALRYQILKAIRAD